MRLGRVLSLLLVLCCQFACAEDRPDGDRPNIVYIMLDDAGYGDLSCYGQQKFATPNVDRLAAEGMKFTQHYSGSTVCAPTRCCLMTGVHTGHAYVRGNREVKPEGQAEMPGDIVTIPRLLSEAGYVTGAFGKWGLGAPGSASDPAEHFDVFFGYNCQREAHRYYPDHLWKNRERVKLDGKTWTARPIMDEALQFVRASQQQPFFLFLPVTIPHAAMQAPEADMAPWRDRFPEFNDRIGRYAGTKTRNPAAAFAAMMTIMDDGVGQLLDLLEELKLDQNTIVFFTSDNGPHKEGGHVPQFFDSNGPLRGHKRDLYEGGIRVPLLVRWPGHIEPGSESDHISAHWDALPTMCELAGIEVPDDTDGISLLPALTGTGDQQDHDYLYWEFYEHRGRRAVRFGNWKAVQQPVFSVDQSDEVELYDLSVDVGEQNDVASDHPQHIERALKLFAKAHTPSPRWKFKPRQRRGR